MTTHADHLARFLDAQAPVFATVCAELKAGRKTSHWMWFIFPQLRGLGHSATSRHFGLASAAEARAYLHHPVLGRRLEHCTDLVMAVDDRSANRIFGSPDDLKFHSSMTLFAGTGEAPICQRAIERFFGGQPDARTTALLARPQA